MRQAIALVLTLALLIGIAAPAAHAGTATNVALGLAAFAVFNQLTGAFVPRPVYAAPVVVTRPVVSATPVYYPPPVYAPPVVAVQPAPPLQTVIHYPHGRYVLHGDGITTAYRWVWIPNPPPPPPQAPALQE